MCNSTVGPHAYVPLEDIVLLHKRIPVVVEIVMLVPDVPVPYITGVVLPVVAVGIIVGGRGGVHVTAMLPVAADESPCVS